MISSQTRTQASLANVPIRVKVWDVETKTLLHEFGSIHKAAAFLGVNHNTVRYAQANKRRLVKNNLNRVLAIR